MRPEDSVGMQRGASIVLHPYNLLWPEEFERVEAELASALPAWIGAIEHVGSTSVPGLSAKPIVDVLMEVPELGRVRELVPAMEKLGFDHRPNDDIPDRQYFPRTIGGLRRHHISVAEPESRHYRNTLIFRNALRADPELAVRYARLKRRLAEEAGTDRLAYLNGKTDFILGVLRGAGGEVGGDYPTRDLGRGGG